MSPPQLNITPHPQESTPDPLFSEMEFFSNMIVNAVQRVKTINSRGDEKYPIKSINILKAHGKSAKESEYIDGYALNCTVASQAMVKRVNNAKIAFLDFNLNKARMGLNVNIVVNDPTKIEGIKQRSVIHHPLD